MLVSVFHYYNIPVTSFDSSIKVKAILLFAFVLYQSAKWVVGGEGFHSAHGHIFLINVLSVWKIKHVF